MKKTRKGIETANIDRLQTEVQFDEGEITGVRSLPSDEPESANVNTFGKLSYVKKPTLFILVLSQHILHL